MNKQENPEEDKKTEEPQEEEKKEEKPQEPETSPGKEEHIDYKAELEKERKKTEEERKKREKAEGAAKRYDIENKELKEKREELEGEGKSPEEIDRLLDEKLSKFENRFFSRINAEEAERKIAELSSSPDEAELIRHHFQNTIQQSGDVDTDIRNAYALANRGKLDRVNSEIERKKQSELTKQHASSAGAEKAIHTEPQVNQETRDFLNKRGYQWDSKKGKYIGPKGQEWLPQQ